MLHSSDSVERFLAVVAHDLRNPLCAISTWTRILGSSADLSEHDRAAVERIARSALRMRCIIDQLVDFTCARQGAIPIDPRAADLGAICHAVVDELCCTYPDRLQLVTSGDLNGRWDGHRLAQVVCNLAANALQHGDGGCVRLNAVGSPADVRVEVHNTGCPISAEMLPQLFDPFCRGDTNRRENLGLGLYIAHQIIQAHRGEIDVSSTANGTVFTISLPRGL